MSPHEEVIVVLRGGTGDGESTTVAPEVTRLYAVSRAVGLLDVYEATGEHTDLRGNEEPALVFAYTGVESAAGVAPEAMHLPPPE
jgi:hypothetical protein